MDRRTVDGDLDDLTLDADLESDANQRHLDDSGADDTAPTGVMAPPPKRTTTRKPPTRKTRTGTPGASGASANGRAASNGSGPRAKAEPKPAEEAAPEPSVAEDSVPENSVPEDREPSAPESEPSVPEASAMETSVADSEPAAEHPENPAAESLVGETEDKAPEDSTPTMVTPAMPADDIWSPQSNRFNSPNSGSWKPAEASERPRGNAFEVPDAFSAPPMPSESTTTTPSFSSSSFSGGRDTVPPSQAFPRPAGAGAPGAVAGTGAAQSPPSTAKPKASVRRSTSARQAHLIIARVEPWSVMKFSFAVSVVAFVALFVIIAVLYLVLSALGVFDSIQHLVSNITSSQGTTGVNTHSWFSASRILGITVLLGGINIVLITAISTIGAVIYNLTSRLIGGVEVTLKESE